MAAIDIRNAQKAYHGLTIMHGVSMHIADGEFVVLVGPSGCGKSTLLRMIAGLEGITGGEILIGDRVVNDLPAKDRDIAMVFQSYALYPHMSVEQNMAFSLRINRRPEDEIDRKVKAAADILGLGPLLDRKPGQLSGGQRQRVAMGRAIVRNPAVFLFDEPLSNLDAQLRVQMRAEIKALHQRLKTTTVYVTHDQVEAMTMADRIVVMNGGRVEQVGRPLELFDRPANLFVARFIGSPQMNLLEGTIEVGKDGPSFRVGDWCIPIAAQNAEHAGRDLVLGFRPEDVELRDNTGPGTTPAKIVLVEPTGTETMINFEVGLNQITAVFHQRLDALPGSTIAIAVKPSLAHLFDRQSGVRLQP